MPEIELDGERCNGCGLCEDFCPVNVFEMVDERRAPAAERSEGRRLLGLRHLRRPMPNRGAARGGSSNMSRPAR